MQKFFRGFTFALNGLIYAIKTQLNVRVQLFAALLVVIAGFSFNISFLEWLAIAICVGCVLAAELMNTSLEALVDLVSPEFNPKAGLVKDIAAAAVLIIALMALTVALIIFVPKIF
ncbi:diacylglycerol kinase family protein [Pedobacter sp. SL55]|uniref:diacylglycerol kinase family protein n=1 Tax=Pedobacter sp. SL55 TaxID=2995161 RepID=UPI00226EDB9A|nr:diacylglycerol kinase family protein [Pedobacter sp. SL55]WAC41354.1 diacylglycerol kinase family protein [Pedobacter sp. SL55]